MAPTATSSPASKADAKSPSNADVPKADAKVEDKRSATPAAEEAADDGPVINMDIFGQIIELDDEDDYSFSWEMVTAYFSQAEQTFTDMDKAFDSKDLKKLSELGHFLKGSSAALGISKLQATCENIQHYGELRDEEKGKDLKPDQALTLIGTLLKGITGDFAAAKKWFINWYKEHGVEEAAELE